MAQKNDWSNIEDAEFLEAITGDREVVVHVWSAGIIHAAPEQLGQNIAIGEIGETGIVW